MGGGDARLGRFSRRILVCGASRSWLRGSSLVVVLTDLASYFSDSSVAGLGAQGVAALLDLCD